MGLFFNKFQDTIFMKESTSLDDVYAALSKLVSEYPDNKKINREFKNVKKGLDGEKEVAYQLKKSNIGLYVLHDVNFEYDGMKAQVDYVVISRACTYFIECKKVYGNLTVNENGDFILTKEYNGKLKRRGIKSPLRQVEAQKDVFKKIWNNNLSNSKIINSIKRKLAGPYFDVYKRVLVVIANPNTILNTRYAPNDVKDKVIKSDGLINKIKHDLENTSKSMRYSQKEMKEECKLFMSINVSKDVDYYEYYKNKYVDNIVNIDDDMLKDKLIKFRKERSSKLNMPAYYVFTNEELEKIIELKPKTLEDLKSILTEIKIKTHGEQILEVLNSNSNQNL